MEFRARFWPKTYVQQRGDNDSSDEEKRPDKDNKNINTPHKPPPHSKWPLHLKDLYDELSASDPSEGLKTAFKLLNALKLDAMACDSLHHNGVIEDMANGLENGTIHFGTKLTGRGSVLIPVFQHLVALDPQTAQRFVRLCDKKTVPAIVDTAAHDCMQALLHTQPVSNQQEARREIEFFIAAVKGIVKEGSDACVSKLEPFIRGCPEEARQKILKHLANDVVYAACESSPSLAATIRKLQKGARVTRSESDIKLAALVLAINIAMSAVDRAEKEAQMAAEVEAEIKGERAIVDRFSFFEKENIIALFKQIEMSLQEKDFDVSVLIAKLCPGAKTPPSHARFVGGLMKFLVDASQGKFNFDNFLEAVLLSDMTGACTKQIASPSLMVVLEKYEVDWNFCSDMRVQAEKRMTISQLMALKQLATEVGHYAAQSGNPDLVEYVNFAIKDCEKIINELTEQISAPHQEALLAHQNAMLEEKRKAVLASLNMESALDAIALPHMESKKSAATTIFDKMIDGELVKEVVDQLTKIGSPQAVELLGSLAAMALSRGDSELFVQMMVRTIDKTTLSTQLAEGLVNIWYQNKLDASLLDHTQHLCQAIYQLGDMIESQKLRPVFGECRKKLEQKITRLMLFTRIAPELQRAIDVLRPW